jgi:amidohydrolase
MKNSEQALHRAAENIAPDLVRIRQHIHMNPELSFQEFETSAFIKKELDQLGITWHEMAGTGVVGLITGELAGSRVVGLRADMDALPIVETEGRSYGSRNPGVMHACGHDVHTTCLLGAARLLQERRAEFGGTVKLVFQPGEEKLPGGASIMVSEGVLHNPGVDVMIGQHVMPQLPVGLFGFREGLYMASTDEIYLTLHGKGGHGAAPHMCIDPVAVSAQIIVALQQLVARKSDPTLPSVLSFGKVQANGATNVIPETVYMEGTFRTLDEAWRDQAHAHIRAIIEHTAVAFGARADLEIRKGYPYLKNNPELTARCRSAAAAYLGAENITNLGIWMAAEDFAYYSHHVPSCFYRLGVRNESKGIIHGVHHPGFDIDESALPLGAGMMAWLALNELAES